MRSYGYWKKHMQDSMIYLYAYVSRYPPQNNNNMDKSWLLFSTPSVFWYFCLAHLYVPMDWFHVKSSPETMGFSDVHLCDFRNIFVLGHWTCQGRGMRRLLWWDIATPKTTWVCCSVMVTSTSRCTGCAWRRNPEAPRHSALVMRGAALDVVKPIINIGYKLNNYGLRGTVRRWMMMW